MRGFAPKKCPRGGELVIFTMSNPLLSPTLSPVSGVVGHAIDRCITLRKSLYHNLYPVSFLVKSG